LKAALAFHWQGPALPAKPSAVTVASIAVEQFRSQLYTTEQASQPVALWVTSGKWMPMGAIKDSKHLTEQLSLDQISFYNRGILNQSDLEPHTEFNALEDYPLSIAMCNSQQPPINPEDLWPSGYYFGDGSGGKFTKCPTLTRAGVGIHHVDLDHKPHFNISTPLP